MLELDGLVMRAGDFTLRAEMTLEPRSRVAVVGPSGAGKSTLLDAIAGFRRPEAGRILWQGRDITADAPGTRPVASLFQDQNLFPHLSLARNLGLALRLGGGRVSAHENQQIEEALAEVGLAGFGARKPAELSGGQASRAALARVLLQNRPVILLDEPFAALGPALKAEMLSRVAELADKLGALALMVSHDPADARRFASQTVLVADGVAEPPRETEALFSDPPDSLRAYLGQA
ncbi:thiamine transport system ATP-binding protein [Roseivivax halotolerans]|uniref:Thiamine transport system ATP-binding protein n=1 Tax=Roseivivax halotolerans TaxID=93684 RepID=A0A1I5WF50_9RHOB|nr:ATP-binding cassette domain-containing protein [Roseivivax halotolerans]SFQ18325.1 thiamine transport system ATP-binding protein [Roseivivax halotolerans]